MNTTNKELDLDKVIIEYTPYVKTIIQNMAGNNLSIEDKEEILSDTFVALWKNQKNITSSISTYIAGITRNLVRKKFRKRNILIDLSDFENSIGYDNTVDYLEENEKSEDLRELFKSLKSIDVKIVNLFYYSSKSTKEIAEELNLSEINVRTRLYRIRKKIRKDIEKGGIE